MLLLTGGSFTTCISVLKMHQDGPKFPGLAIPQMYTREQTCTIRDSCFPATLVYASYALFVCVGIKCHFANDSCSE